MVNTPLEQFQIVSLLSPKHLWVFGMFTNYTITNAAVVFGLLLFVHICSSGSENSPRFPGYFIPNSLQKGLESISEVTAQLVSETITSNSEKYFVLIAALFNFILFSNLIGLIPYTFTPTSHLIVTFLLSFSVFIGINVVTFRKYEMKSFSLFLPANTTFFLALFLVPIEFISYIARPISLGVRLFVNIMAGHTLLKVIVGFSWSMLILENFVSFGLIVPLFMLVLLFGLELGVALIQTYVFVVLTCIYIQDGS
jgi:ATP synthase subunit 6